MAVGVGNLADIQSFVANVGSLNANMRRGSNNAQIGGVVRADNRRRRTIVLKQDQLPF